MINTGSLEKLKERVLRHTSQLTSIYLVPQCDMYLTKHLQRRSLFSALCKQAQTSSRGGSSLPNFGQTSTYTSSSYNDHPDEFTSALERKQEQAEGLKPQQNHRLAAPRGSLYSFLYSSLWRSSFRSLCSKTSTFLPHWVTVLQIGIAATKRRDNWVNSDAPLSQTLQLNFSSSFLVWK